MKALVLSGGGEKGAYQVGALRYLVEKGLDPDIITGVSVGAMNGGFLSQFPRGRFDEAVEKLAELWEDISTEDVVRHWFPPYVRVPWKGCVYDSSPQRGLVDRWVNPDRVMTSGRRFAAVSVDWVTGEIVVGREWCHNICDHIKASSSFPLFMEPVLIGDKVCTDGGVRDVSPIKQAMQMGAKEIIVIACSNPDLPSKWGIPSGISSFIDYAMRAVDIMSTEIVANDYKVCGLKNDLAVTSEEYELISLAVIHPTRPLGTKSLEFSPAQSAALMERGYEDAKVNMP